MVKVRVTDRSSLGQSSKVPRFVVSLRLRGRPRVRVRVRTKVSTRLWLRMRGSVKGVYKVQAPSRSWDWGLDFDMLRGLANRG